MDTRLSTLTIPPRAVDQFEKIFRSRYDDPHALKNPERTLIRLLRQALPHTSTTQPKENLLHFSVNEYLFVVTEDTNTLVEVSDLKSDVTVPSWVPPPPPIRLSDYHKPTTPVRLWPVMNRSVKTGPPPIDMHKVRFTRHATERFAERYGCSLYNAESRMWKLLSQSTEDSGAHKKKMERMFKYDFKNSRYFVNGDWRFVVIEQHDLFRVVTFEWI